MNKYQKELLEKCKRIESWNDDVPLLDEIYILPTTYKHDSGYKIMYVVGYSDKTKEYYFLDGCCDVINLGFLKSNIKNINIDIEHNGIIRLWNDYQRFKSTFRLSNCTFEFVDKEGLYDR